MNRNLVIIILVLLYFRWTIMLGIVGFAIGYPWFIMWGILIDSLHYTTE